MRERNQSLDAGKGFAIILVMLGHCIVLNGLQDGYIYDALKAVQMPFFMMISGYIASFTAQIESAAELRKKIQKRAVSYLLPFFMWIIVLHPTKIGASIKDILFQLDKGLWFLMTLFLLTVVLYLAVFVSRRTKLPFVGFLSVWALFSMLLLYQTIKGNQFLSPHLTIYHMPFYVGGFLTGRFLAGKGKKYMEEGLLHIRAVRTIFTMAAGAAFVYLIVQYDMITADNKLELLMQFLAGFLGCFLCFRFVFALNNKRFKKALSLIGLYTLEIYVLHFHFATVLGLAEKNLTLWSVQGALWVLAAFLIMCIATAAGIVILGRFRITNLLLFGKEAGRQSTKLRSADNQSDHNTEDSTRQHL